MKDFLGWANFLFDHVSDAVIATDLQSRIVMWNRAAESIYGYTAAEALDQNVGELLQTEFLGDGRARAFAALERDGHWEQDVIQRRRDGRRISVSASVTLARDDERSPIGIVAVNRDITRLRELERSMLHASRLEVLGGLAAAIAHDVRNWLNATELLVSGAARKAARNAPIDEEVCGIHDAVRRSAELLDRLTSFGRPRAEGVTAVDWCQAVEATLYLLDRLAGPDISIEVERMDGPLPVDADLTSLDQIILNLVVNARDAMPDGGSIFIALSPVTVNDPEATTRGVTSGRYARLCVRDQGTGMPPEIVSRIFEPYFTTKPEGKGTGLGLATTHEIVRRHGGSIDVESTMGVGTVFSVLLPAAPSAGATSLDH